MNKLLKYHRDDGLQVHVIIKGTSAISNHSRA